MVDQGYEALALGRVRFWSDVTGERKMVDQGYGEAWVASVVKSSLIESLTRPAMCTTSECDLEEIPLDDDDPNSLEFKILEFYVKQHVFKNNSAVFSPECEKPIILAKKKSSWRTFFGVVEKEEDSLRSSTEIHRQGQRTVHLESGHQSQSGSRSLSNVERCLKREAAHPKVVCIANRVAEIVYSWPPP
ncbi:Apoptosis Facilitator Bcl-2-Like Protein 14 [Manis pentadactyla]|nr:Apoptosis Facilitator Bcl-2-Like Protein 14 [Manis pentadactyla]